MAAVDCSKCEAVEISSETADDGTIGDDHVTAVTDDDTSTGVFKPGKGGSSDGDCARVEYASGVGDLAVGDTISIWLTSVHQIDDGMDLLAYTDSNSVTATGRINKDAPISTGENIYTLTSAFIGQLGDLGSGAFAVRYAPRAQEAGDVQVSEVDADLTPAGVATVVQDPLMGPGIVPFAR